MSENMIKTENLKCPMFGEQCRHCSHETTTHPYTVLERDPKTNLYKPLRHERAIRSLGAYCNNACQWVERMNVCPTRWLKQSDKMLPKEIPTQKKKELKKKKVEQKWKLRKDGPTKRGAEILHVGQQKLFIEQR
jgi:hypothetical protein